MDIQPRGVEGLFQNILKLYQTQNADEVVQSKGPMMPPRMGDMQRGDETKGLPRANRPGPNSYAKRVIDGNGFGGLLVNLIEPMN